MIAKVCEESILFDVKQMLVKQYCFDSISKRKGRF